MEKERVCSKVGARQGNQDEANMNRLIPTSKHAQAAEAILPLNSLTNVHISWLLFGNPEGHGVVLNPHTRNLLRLSDHIMVVHLFITIQYIPYSMRRNVTETHGVKLSAIYSASPRNYGKIHGRQTHRQMAPLPPSWPP